MTTYKQTVDSPEWHIYLGKIPYTENGLFWVSFESDPGLKRTKANIYARCLPCIQHLYEQLRAGKNEIDLGRAYHCWKVTAVLDHFDDCLNLLDRFEALFPAGHVYGKLGNGRTDSSKKVVVFHADNEPERDRLEKAMQTCLKTLDADAHVIISRACSILYEPLLGDWRQWRPTAAIRFPEKVAGHLERIKKILTYGTM
jgi:hypothetical protein